MCLINQWTVSLELLILHLIFSTVMTSSSLTSYFPNVQICSKVCYLRTSNQKNFEQVTSLK